MNNLLIRAEPYAHQKEAFTAALESFRSGKSYGYALLMEMGTGKTMVSIAVAGRLYLDCKISKVLIVAPVSVLTVWGQEINRFADYDFNAAILEGSLSKKADTLRHLTGSPLQIAIVNYESVCRLEDQIKAWKPDMIIADESHKIKNHTANASKALHKIAALSKYRLILTGTLAANKPIDVFKQYKMAAPEIFGNSFYSFRNRYFDMIGYGAHTPVMKRSMENELTQKIHSIAFRATKSECFDLPEVTDVIRSVPLEPTARKLYRELVKDSYTELQNGESVSATNILTRLLRLSQLTGGFLGGDDDPATKPVSIAKLEVLRDHIETVQSENRKIVIIARFIAEINAIKKLLNKMDIKFSAISGETKDRAEQVRSFQEDDSVTAFLGQISTAGLGITLTAASVMVFYSLNYSSSDFEQAKARIHRSGQTEPCTYYYLLAENTVDEKVLTALRNKQELAKSLVDDYKSGINPFG
jgi:SNF2 family DNA or RNA helicase